MSLTKKAISPFIYPLILIILSISVFGFWAENNKWIEDSQESNLNVNSSVYWDTETSQSNLNVNNSIYWNDEDSPSNLNTNSSTYWQGVGIGSCTTQNKSILQYSADTSLWQCSQDLTVLGKIQGYAGIGVLDDSNNGIAYLDVDTGIANGILFGENVGNKGTWTGNNNIAIGHSVLNSITSGHSNMAIGVSALDAVQVGQANLAVGISALGSHKNSYTVAIGNAAGFTSTGSRSTYVGYRAGYTATGIYGGNVMIGHKAGYSESNSYRLYIDSDDTTEPLIYGEFDTDSLKINGRFNTSTLSSYNDSTVNTNNRLLEVISDTRGTPQFMVQDGGPSQASLMVRSWLVVNQNNTLLNQPQNNVCSDWGFKHLDCNTSTTGADFGVTDDIEGLGVIYANEGLRSHTTDYGSYLVLGDRAGLYKGINGIYNYETNIFCDFVANNFDDTGSLSQWIVIQEESIDYTEARADVGAFINSSCILLEHNPSWDKDFNTTNWGMKTGMNLVSQSGGFLEYYVGSHEESGFKIKGSNATASTTFYVDDIAGASQHQGMTLDYEMGNYEGQVGLNILMKKGDEQIVDKDLTMLLLEGEATNLNGSSGVFIDMQVIGTPLNADGEIHGIHMPPNMNTLIKVGSGDTLSSAYSEDINITGNMTDGGESAVFVNDNDYLYVGNELNFTTMGFVLDTEGSTNIDPEYFYCDNTGTWQTLGGVTDTTNGFKVGGTITFDSPVDRGLCNKEYDGTPFSDTANYTYIAIKRTRNNVVTTPVIETITISGGTTNMYMTEDLLRLHPHDTAPETCTAVNLGAIYYDISEDDMCVCRSSGWKVMTDGSECT